MSPEFSKKFVAGHSNTMPHLTGKISLFFLRSNTSFHCFSSQNKPVYAFNVRAATKTKGLNADVSDLSL